MEFRIINPQLLAIAHGDAGRIPLRFTTEFVRALEPDLSRTADRFVQHLDVLFFLEIGLELRRGGPFFANSAEKCLKVRGRKRLGAEERRAEQEHEKE